MISVFRIDPAAGTVDVLDPDRGLSTDWRARPGWLWVHSDGAGATSEDAVLRQLGLSLHALSLSDARRHRHPPKYETFDDYEFLILFELLPERERAEFVNDRLSLFIGTDFLFTRSHRVSASCRHWREILADGYSPMARGPFRLAAAIVRRALDRLNPLFLDLEQRLEDVEEGFETLNDEQLLSELVVYNSRLKRGRRLLGYQSRVIADWIAEEDRERDDTAWHLLQDLKEHGDRYASLAALYQEIVADLINGYLSLNAHQLNQVMKVLTVVTVIFLPLSLLAGIYGMNFERMPELHWPFGYFLVLGVMAGLAVSLLALFRHLKWL